MPDVNLIRRDGTTVSVPEAQADALRRLGYRDEAPEEAAGRAIAAGEQAYYSTPGQQALALGEGAVSGLTAGLADPLMADASTTGRAHANPGKRFLGELAGAGAAAIATGGESLLGDAASLTPTGLITRGGEAIAGAVGGGLRGAAIRGAAEGAAYGAGGAVTRATIEGDPITAEGVLDGAGWGSLYGAGLSAGVASFGRGAERLGARLATADAAAEAARVAARTPAVTAEGLVDAGAYGPLHAAAKDFSARAADAAATVEDGLGTSALGAAPREALEAHAQALKQAGDAISGESTIRPGSYSADAGTLALNRRAIAAGWRNVNRAITDGDPAKLQDVLAQYRETLTKAQEAMGPRAEVGIPGIEHVVADEAMKRGENAIKEAAALRAAGEALSGFPQTPAAFFGMRSARAEKTFAALEHALSGSAPELESLRASLKTAADGVAEAVGVSAHDAGGPIANLRAAWSAGKRSLASEAVRAGDRAEAEAGRSKGFLGGIFQRGARHAGGRVASHVVSHVAGGTILPAFAYQAGAALGHGLGGGLLGMAAEVTGFRAAATNRIQRAVAAWGPGAARAGAKVAARVEPLARRLDGTLHPVGPTEQDRREAAVARSREILSAAPAVRDTLYRAAAPISAAGHPEFAQALHKTAVAAFDALVAAVPRDPGSARTARGTLWRPSPEAVATFSHVLRVFHDGPAATFERWFSGDRVPHPAEVKAAGEMYPGMYADMRGAVLVRLSDPEVTAGMTVHDQRRLGAIIGRPVHSVTAPEFVLAQQKMFMSRVDPKGGSSGPPAPTQPAPGGAYHTLILPGELASPGLASGGGAAATPGAGATQAQTATQR